MESTRDSIHNSLTALAVISYNMHGYNQGFQTIRDFICDIKPDLFLLQEHWLTTNKLSKFNDDFPEYLCVIGYEHSC